MQKINHILKNLFNFKLSESFEASPKYLNKKKGERRNEIYMKDSFIKI